MYNEQFQQDIQIIMNEFAWERVQTVMTALNWEWVGYGIPPLPQLKRTARYLLNEVAEDVLRSTKKKYIAITSTGGFEAKAQKFKDTDKIYLELKFVVTEWGNYE